MVESEAQGRLPGIAPVSVVDIGSNSIRLVIYEGMSRAPAILFNEKVMCGLGKGIAKTGRMDPASVERALAALHRFKALSWQARTSTMFALATAAAREAENGPDFIRRAEAILGQKVRVLTGEEEAYFSALGVVSGFHDPDGIVGDLGGGSPAQARIVARKYLRTANLLKHGAGRAFYAVGGTWRAIGALHMAIQNYPLHMIQGYELGFSDAMDFLTDIVTAKDQKDPAYSAISKGRRNLLPFGAVALQETIAIMKPSRVFFSAQGVREGYLYSLLPAREKARAPLIAAASELAILRARSPEHARELAEWTGRMMPLFGIAETEEERRYREAACLLADISWRAHPDYRGLQALNLIAHGTFIGITHPGRAFIALTNYYRFEGLNDDAVSSSLAGIATPRFRELAKLVGGLLRVVYLFSASMPGVVPHLAFRKASQPDVDLEFAVPADYAELAGERLDGRLQQLARLTGKKLAFKFLR